GNINSKGFGNIRFTVDPRGEFEIFGDYSFLRGTFFFTLQNLINRRFAILQGGKISFDGNPYNADVSLKALYKLKTSLSGLGANISPEYEGQRVNVDAFLGLNGMLTNPDINFSIGFPNVKDEVQQTIYAILDTNDVALMNQQMISLLVMSSFSYASASTNVSASSLNIISSQLSNWLSQISNDFDVGINYIAGDEINQDELEVALSTQFFDNRLIIDGNVGVMTKDNTQQQASNIVGDVNIEYKLTPDGRIRLKAFNRSNNFNTIDYYAPYTQGVGVFYTKEFDGFGDLFRRQHNRKNKDENQPPDE
ncbi:MAG: translocation/assembly module TamB domain-containing protein, partial [Bacteroidota bacterium]